MKFCKLMEYSFVVEHQILDFIMNLIGDNECDIKKSLGVSHPFGNKKVLKRKDHTILRPELCLIVRDKKLAFLAEVAGLKDTQGSNKNYSNCHCFMWDLIKRDLCYKENDNRLSDECKMCIYFAQKIICQLFAAYFSLKKELTDFTVKCYYGCVKEHKDIIENLLQVLKNAKYVINYNRPLGYMNYDINRYAITIFELEFPNGQFSEDIVNKMRKSC